MTSERQPSTIEAATHPMESLMTADERDVLIQALGRADAALNFVRTLTNMLIRKGVMKRSDLIEAIDASAYVVEEELRGDRGSAALVVQHDQHLSFLEELHGIPPDQEPPPSPPASEP